MHLVHCSSVSIKKGSACYFKLGFSYTSWVKLNISSDLSCCRVRQDAGCWMDQISRVLLNHHRSSLICHFQPHFLLLLHLNSLKLVTAIPVQKKTTDLLHMHSSITDIFPQPWRGGAEWSLPQYWCCFLKLWQSDVRCWDYDTETAYT